MGDDSHQTAAGVHCVAPNPPAAGSTLVSNINNQGELFFDMLTYNNGLFDKHFGPHPRYDPAHAPRLMQKKYLQELQDKLPDAFEQTSASPVRCALKCLRSLSLSWQKRHAADGQVCASALPVRSAHTDRALQVLETVSISVYW